MTGTMKILVLLGASLILETAATQLKCEPLKIPLCQRLNYNMTIVPNFHGHRTQGEAATTMGLISRLLITNCSPDVLHLACSYYAPICTAYGKMIPPCRSLCRSVKRDCTPVMKKIYRNFRWPNSWKCRRFPSRRKELCFGRRKSGRRSKSQTSFYLD